MTLSDRILIDCATFRKMARKGARADDFAGYSVFKASGTVVKAGSMAGQALGPRQIGFILSNGNEDREQDTIDPQGWQLDDYKRNPVVLWAHDHTGLPVAKAINTFVDTDAQLKALDEFADPDVYGFADSVLRLIQGGFLNACSVGFQPSEWDMSDAGVNFLKQSLLEHSVCPVPAHPQALVIARSKGINVAPLKQWAEKTLDLFASRRKSHLTEQIKKQLETLRVQTDPLGRKVLPALCDINFDDDIIELDGEDSSATPDSRAELDRRVTATSTVWAEVAAANRELQMPTVGSTDEAASRARAALTTIVSGCDAVIEGIAGVRSAAVAALSGTPAPAVANPQQAALIRHAAQAFNRLSASMRTKVGARHSAADQKLLQDAHDSLVQLGATCTPMPEAGKRLRRHVDDDDLDISPEEVAEIISRSISDAITQATGKLP